MLIPILSFLIFTAVCWWVVFRDGAEVIEGWRSVIFFDLWAWLLNAEQLRLYAVISWLAAAVMLGIGNPPAFSEQQKWSYAAIASFIAGVMPPSAMLGRSWL